MIRAMDNVGLVIILAHQMLSIQKENGTNSIWKPYLDLLPVSYTTPLFYSIEQLQALKPSSVFEEALNMYRAVARQFVYFYLRILSDYNSADIKTGQQNGHIKPFIQSPFNPKNFTFDLYRWCVATVSTRINMIPSSKQTSQKNGDAFRMIPALIPFIDLANHDHTKNKSGSVFLASETGNVHLQIHQKLESSKEIFIHYGARSNSKFLLHNGFVPESFNPDNRYELRIGLPKNPTNEYKHKYLETIQISSQSNNGVFVFWLPSQHNKSLEETKKLWNFVRVVVAKSLVELSDQLDSVELKERAKKFICDRLQLLVSAPGYSGLEPPNLKEFSAPDSDDAIIATNIWRLKHAELMILRNSLKYFLSFL